MKRPNNSPKAGTLSDQWVELKDTKIFSRQSASGVVGLNMSQEEEKTMFAASTSGVAIVQHMSL